MSTRPRASTKPAPHPPWHAPTGVAYIAGQNETPEREKAARDLRQGRMPLLKSTRSGGSARPGRRAVVRLVIK